MSQPVQANQAGAGGPVQADPTVNVLNTLVLTYLTLVGHLNKVWLVILQGTLTGHLMYIHFAPALCCRAACKKLI